MNLAPRSGLSSVFTAALGVLFLSATHTLHAQPIERTYTFDPLQNRTRVSQQVEFRAPEVFLARPGVVERAGRLNIFGRGFPPGRDKRVEVTIGGVEATVLAVSTRVIHVAAPAGVARGEVLVRFPGVAGAQSAGTLSVQSVEVMPAIAFLDYEETEQFEAGTFGLAAARFEWTVNGAPGGNARVGTVSEDGLYTAPARGTGVLYPILVEATAETRRSGAARVVPACVEPRLLVGGAPIVLELDGSGRRICFEFDGSAGEAVAVGTIGESIVALTLRTPGHETLETRGSGRGQIISGAVLPETGRYRVEIETQVGVKGTVGLSLTRSGGGRPIEFNTPTAGTIAEAAQVDEWTFAGLSGSTLSVDFETPWVSSQPDLMALLELVRPDGTVLADTASGCPSLTQRLDRVPLDATGTWTVRVRARANWNCRAPIPALATGDYTLSVCPSSGAPTPLTPGDALAASFTADCQIYNVDFEASANELASVAYVGTPFARRLELFAPDGSLLASRTDDRALSIFDLSLPADGLYRVVLEAKDGQTGAFALGVHRLGSDVQPIALNTPTAGTIAEAAQVDEWTFAGLSGSTLSVDFETPWVSSQPDLMALLELVRPDGTVLADTASGCPSLTQRLDRVPLDATGTWTVRVRARANWNCRAPIPALATGDYTLSVLNDTEGGGAVAGGVVTMAGPRFRRGDVDANGRVDLGDALALLDRLFRNPGGPLPCADAADATDDGRIDLGDALAIIEQVVASNNPSVPLGICWRDSTPDPLDCRRADAGCAR